MQLGQPCRVEPQFVGQLYLGNGVPVTVGRLLVFRARQLIKDPELHEYLQGAFGAE